MNAKKLAQVKAAPSSRGMGPAVRQVVPTALGNVDPFVFLDHFGPITKQPGRNGGVPPHPHAGIATITYLFDGSNRHQDSLGNDAVVNAGDLAWMQAGRGIVHAEGVGENRTAPETVHGLQFWISLPAKDKFAEPRFTLYPSENLPRVSLGAATIKVLCGSLLSGNAPVHSLSPAYIYELFLPAGEQIWLPLADGYTAALYVVSGAVAVEGKPVGPAAIAGFGTAGDGLQIGSTADSHAIVFGGQPLNEPIVAYASYVMNSEEQIRRVMADYAVGKMGHVAVG